MTQLVIDLAFVAGCVAVVVGCWLLGTAEGIIATGVALSGSAVIVARLNQGKRK